MVAMGGWAGEWMGRDIVPLLRYAVADKDRCFELRARGWAWVGAPWGNREELHPTRRTGMEARSQNRVQGSTHSTGWQ